MIYQLNMHIMYAFFIPLNSVQSQIVIEKCLKRWRKNNKWKIICSDMKVLVHKQEYCGKTDGCIPLQILQCLHSFHQAVVSSWAAASSSPFCSHAPPSWAAASSSPFCSHALPSSFAFQGLQSPCFMIRVWS